MRNHFKVLVIIAALCVIPFQSMAAQPVADSVREEWAKAWNGKDLKALLSLYDDDAILTAPTGERITGRDNIENYLTPIIKDSSNFSFSNPKTDHSGKLVQDSGSL